MLDVLTKDSGLFRLLAKGAGKGRFGLLQPFSLLSIAWTGRSELQVLSRVESLDKPLSLSGKALFCGFYLNELLLKLLPTHDPNPNIFIYYQETLNRMSQGAALDESLRFFELALLEEIGYGLMLDDEIKEDSFYQYSILEGPIEVKQAPGTLKGSTLLGLKYGNLSGSIEQNEAKRLMRRVIQYHLGGKELKSRELFGSTG